jgi:hypothetical protein
MSTDNSPETSSEITVYRDALQTAYDEWLQIQQVERRYAMRKNQLRQTFLALLPLAYPVNTDPDVSTMSLSNAIRMVVGGNERPITAIEMRGRLTDLGFDLSKYENPLANIHTAMNRMVESEEFAWADMDEKKVIAGPELKSVPTPPPASQDFLQNSIMSLLSAMNPTEEKK